MKCQQKLFSDLMINPVLHLKPKTSHTLESLGAVCFDGMHGDDDDSLDGWHSGSKTDAGTKSWGLNAHTTSLAGMNDQGGLPFLELYRIRVLKIPECPELMQIWTVQGQKNPGLLPENPGKNWIFGSFYDSFTLTVSNLVHGSWFWGSDSTLALTLLGPPREYHSTVGQGCSTGYGPWMQLIRTIKNITLQFFLP